MVSHLFSCWECGKDVRGGLCMGPHPGFSLERAVIDGHIELPVDQRIEVVREFYPGSGGTLSYTREYQRAKAQAWREGERERLLARRTG